MRKLKKRLTKKSRPKRNKRSTMRIADIKYVIRVRQSNQRGRWKNTQYIHCVSAKERDRQIRAVKNTCKRTERDFKALGWNYYYSIEWDRVN